MDESQLIHEYASSRSDDAFKAIIDQYVSLVYAACYRQLKDRHLAEDAAQAVFILFSQKAGALGQTYLTGWLLTTCRYVCANIRKSQQRRQRREQVVAMKPTTATQAPSGELLDLLDEALCHLKAADREALVLRYLKEQSLDDVADKLGVSPDAARKRIDRGVEKLRQYFSRRGIVTTSAALGATLSEQVSGATMTPAVRYSLTQGILHACTAGARGSTASAAIAKGTKTMILFNKLKIGAVVAAIAGAVGTTGWMISRASADNSPAPQVADSVSAPSPAPQAAVASAPPAAPNTASSPIDLSTPENAARSFFTALREGDRAKAYACLTADPNRPPNIMDAILAWNLAQNHLVHVVSQSFGGDGAGLKHMVTLDTIAQAIVPTPSMAPQEVIHGDAATMTINVPSWIIAIVPTDYQRHLRDWSGKTLYFHKQAGQWKFDLDRSMRISSTFLDNNHRPLDAEAKIAIVMQYVHVMEQIATAIANGQITSSDGATAALNNARSSVVQDYGVSSMDFNVVPGDGGN